MLIFLGIIIKEKKYVKIVMSKNKNRYSSNYLRFCVAIFV